jgi:hypothetical protein
MYEKGLTPNRLDLPADLKSFLAMPEVRHRDVDAVIGKHACRDSAETAASTGDQRNTIK